MRKESSFHGIDMWPRICSCGFAENGNDIIAQAPFETFNLSYWLSTRKIDNIWCMDTGHVIELHCIVVGMRIVTIILVLDIKAGLF